MCSNQPKTVNDYTIGWVCALATEQTAATGMLDEIHPSIKKPANDPNNYTLGSIGGHNIVIACLPEGQIGNNSAATVATFMVTTFPRIKFGLMVGIGGGVPPKVRLGDVVVSRPISQYPGVVQWDMGKARAGGAFERTGALNNPPTALLTALTRLKSDHEMAGTKIPEYLKAMVKKWPRMSSYLKSDDLEDVLFKAAYPHVERGEEDEEEEEEEEEPENCRYCCRKETVKRKPRDAVVHYGLIASGNKVIKDAALRNELNKEFGKELLCVEMEAAGLMNNFPCIVIRGICDYADSHKNKDWQKHAAAMAAGFGKELLQYVSPADVEKEPTQTVFCPGMPGAGKTILAAVVIDNVASRFSQDPSAGVAYIYFNFWQQDRQSVEDLFASLLKQLTQRQPSLPDKLRKLSDQHQRKGTRPSVDEILDMLHWTIGERSRVFIIVDALDECPTAGGCRAAFLTALLELRKYGANVLATSRSIPEITEKFDLDTWLEIRARDEDITKFVDAQVSQWGSDLLKSMRAEVTESTVTAASGMQPPHDRFLLAKLGVDSLMDHRLPRDIKTALKALPKGSNAYRVAYEDAMKRMEHQGPKSTQFAKRVISWMVCAKRQLTLSELRHALALEVGDPQLDLDNLPLPQDIVSVCAGLVTVDQGSGIISLVHYTTQEYFERTRNQWFPTADDDMAKACTTYLSFDVFQRGPCLTDTDFEERLQTYPLYDYAAHFWGHHAREAASEDPLILEFSQSEAKTEASSQALLAIKDCRCSWSIRDIAARMGGLHLAAYFGLEKLVPALIGKFGVDPEDGDKRTPLSWAAQNGHESVVRLLLGEGANKASTDNSGMTPLSWATRGGHDAVVQLL
ncbi:hypothetical protein B0I37DRAFT_312184, partial [Chaetomium sp. MPI-CAGE-AT-0009]